MEVEIINFMCHEKLNINLDNFQIISAENGAGKSAIFHAINWCINGGSNNFIKRGKKESSVSIKINNDVYKREVIKDKYFVYKNDLEICTTKDSLKDLGVNIPIEYFSQFDKLFLLNETPKNRADILNSMFDIEKIETASSDITKEIKDDRKELETLIDKNENNKNILITLEEKNLKLINIYESYNKTKEINDNISNLKNKLNTIKNTPDTIKTEIDYSVLKKIQSIINLKCKLKNSINKIEADLKYLKVIRILEKNKKIKKAPDKIVTDIVYDNLKKITNIKDKVTEFNKNKEMLSKLKKEIEDIENKLKGSVCPCCKKKI